jgi:hypothetical protein
MKRADDHFTSYKSDIEAQMLLGKALMGNGEEDAFGFSFTKERRLGKPVC